MRAALDQLNLPIIYHDDALIIVNKPAYLLSVPGRYAFKFDSVTYRLQTIFPFAREVHRLDWETSGIMVVALNKEAHRHVSMQFQDRQTQKRYIAIVDGKLDHDNFTIDLPLRLDWENRPLHMVCHELGKPSQTFVRLDQYHNGNSRVILEPITGRSHQLRVHMQAIGHPILGDSLYANPNQQAKAARLMLHAEYLNFTHPMTGQDMHIEHQAPF